MSQRPQSAPDQRGLARAEVTLQIDHQARHEAGGQSLAGREGVVFIFEMQAHGAAVIIAFVNEPDHAVFSSTCAPEADAAFFSVLTERIRLWGKEAGFDAVAIADIDLSAAEPGLTAWLADGLHGEMDYMARHGMKRARPAELVPGTVRIISVRMNYLPAAEDAIEVLEDRSRGYVSRYALGRDYHKLLRNRLQKLAERIAGAAPHGFRVFVDSAPVLEVEIAAQAGLGWRGKHTLLLDRAVGSFFFLGEIFTDLPLPVDAPLKAHCGTCSACVTACPTGAIVAPYRVDARRCISYLTIELHGAIPEPLRPLIGNRIYGCDDCQLFCPWNRFARLSVEHDFAPRHALDKPDLVELFAWSEADFKSRMAGSAIHRIGHERWLRNVAVALGNAPTSAAVLAALRTRADDASALVREHVAWALARHGAAPAADAAGQPGAEAE